MRKSSTPPKGARSHEDSRPAPVPTGLPARSSRAGLYRGATGRCRPVRHHRPHRRRQEHPARRPVSGAVRQYAQASPRPGARLPSGGPGRLADRHRRPPQPAEARRRQRLRRGRLHRSRRTPLPRAMGRAARPGQGRRQAAGGGAIVDRPGRRTPVDRPEARIRRADPRAPGAIVRAVHPRRAAGPERVRGLSQGRRQRPLGPAREAHQHPGILAHLGRKLRPGQGGPRRGGPPAGAARRGRAQRRQRTPGHGAGTRRGRRRAGHLPATDEGAGRRGPVARPGRPVAPALRTSRRQPGRGRGPMGGTERAAP